jgi:hypothetical protein
MITSVACHKCAEISMYMCIYESGLMYEPNQFYQMVLLLYFNVLECVSKWKTVCKK